MPTYGKGRYLISVEDVQERRQVVIHDTDGGTDERCNIDQIKTKSLFDDLAWGLEKGYKKCHWCFPESPSEALTDSP